ncbi:MAG: hypothetical protein K8S21_06375 [Gemmatimonadetes bacterium]|nr:hypothetical protein [Gemmatimonadota bacterium]
MSFRPLFALVAILSLPAAAAAQSVAGSWSSPTPRGAITLTLRVSGTAVSGTLAGNGVSMIVKGTAEADEAYGTVEGGGGTAIFTAHVEGSRLSFAMTENGANGQPNPGTARELIFTRGGGAAEPTGSTAPAPAPATATAPATAPAPSASGRGANPLGGPAGGGAAANPLGGGGADPLVGTFLSADLNAVITRGAQGYSGVLFMRGEEYPFTATASGARLSGTFAAAGQRYPFESRLAGDEMTLSSGGKDYGMLRKGAAAPSAARTDAMPGAAPSPVAPAPASGGLGLVGATGVQERQIAQLLVSSAWCYMSYSGGSTYTGGSYGRTSTERVVFAADGMGSTNAGSENANSGGNGSVASQGSSGQRFMWKIQGMNLVLSQDGAQWSPIPLQIYDNGSGAPIVKSQGKEYSRCN